MSSLNIKEKPLFLRSWIISLFIHLFLLSSFIFVFPASQTAFKPEFTFWGSILLHQDISKGTASQKRANHYPLNESLSTVASSAKPLFMEQVKPEGVNVIQDKKTSINKSMFYDEPEDTKKHTFEVEDLNFEFNLPAYSPLKYKNNDQN